MAVAPIAAIEVAQLFGRHHSPEITDPLLILAAAITMWVVQSWEESNRRPAGAVRRGAVERGAVGQGAVGQGAVPRD